MRVALVHKFHHVVGGAEVYYQEVGRLLEAQDHVVARFSTQDVRNLPSAQSHYFVRRPEYQTGPLLARAAEIGRVIWSTNARRQFGRLLDDFRPDIVHAFGIHVHLSPSILAAAYDRGIPVVMSCNDYKHICPNYKLFHHGHTCTDCRGGRFYSAVKNRCCKDSVAFSAVSALEAYVHNWRQVYDRYVATFLFSSHFMAAETARFWGDTSFRWRLLRNPFDSPSHDMSQRDDGYALFFGRLVEEKGVDTLIRAASLTPDVPVLVVGDGPEDGALRQLADLSGARNVMFIGPKWGAEMNDIINRAGFVIVPSSWHENLPYVINQAFAVGKAVVGSRRGGIPEMVGEAEGERGVLFTAGDANELAAAMYRLHRDPSLRRTMGTAAKRYSDAEFNDQRFYDTLLPIYQEALDGYAGTRR